MQAYRLKEENQGLSKVEIDMQKRSSSKVKIESIAEVQKGNTKVLQKVDLSLAFLHYLHSTQCNATLHITAWANAAGLEAPLRSIST